MGRSPHADGRGNETAGLHAPGNTGVLLPHRRCEKRQPCDIALLEHCVREDLNESAPRAMAVLRPLKVVIDNYPEGTDRGYGMCEPSPKTGNGNPKSTVFKDLLYRK